MTDEKKTTKDESQSSDHITVSLTIKDRLMLIDVFPKKSNILGQVIAKEIRERVALSKEESDEIKLRSAPMGQGLAWDGEKADKLVKDYPFSNAEVQFLKDQIARIDKQEDVTQDLVDVALKIKAI